MTRRPKGLLCVTGSGGNLVRGTKPSRQVQVVHASLEYQGHGELPGLGVGVVSGGRAASVSSDGLHSEHAREAEGDVRLQSNAGLWRAADQRYPTTP